MDSKLKEILSKWENLLTDIKEKEEIFFQLKAQKDSLFGKIFLAQAAKTISEREYMANQNSDYANFLKGLAVSESDYQDLARRLELVKKEYDAEHLSLKIDSEFVKKY